MNANLRGKEKDSGWVITKRERSITDQWDWQIWNQNTDLDQ